LISVKVDNQALRVARTRHTNMHSRINDRVLKFLKRVNKMRELERQQDFYYEAEVSVLTKRLK